jgi:ADP-ribosylglycohydrolase
MLPNDYIEKVYAGVLGKIIGVYLGRPFEGWTFEKIISTLGEVAYYVHDRLGVPLVVTDDDISGTFTFLRALPDHGNTFDITSEQIGNTWLNYLIENRTVLWWGGLGNSTEHTAYLRLKRGIPAPLSGSQVVNGKVVSDQIGAQIFIDGWAMVCPGDPEKAVDLAGRAARVSHDGEAVIGAQVIAAMESLAFVESDLNVLLDTALTLTPKDSVIYRLVCDLREWRQKEPDWKKARQRIEAHYGYDRYSGNCHIVPNHALIHLGLLYGDDDFQKTLMITNTAGWDTDCNSGNVGCLMGIKNGLIGIDKGPDWRGPVADRLYLPTADGGRSISDAVREAYQIVNIARSLNNLHELKPKEGARFHFELPGSLQGFSTDDPEFITLSNVGGNSKLGTRSLEIDIKQFPAGKGVRVKTATFIPPEALTMGGYGVIASPTLYPGQTIHARISIDETNNQTLSLKTYISAYGENDKLVQFYSEECQFINSQEYLVEWKVPNYYLLIGMPIAEVGFEFSSNDPTGVKFYLDYLTWEGCPAVAFKRPSHKGNAWRLAWTNAVDQFDSWVEPYRLIQNEGRGLLIQGCRDWKDYQVSADVTPHMVKSAGLAARIQGMRRYYAFLLCDDAKARLIKVKDQEVILAERDITWRLNEGANLSLRVEGNRLTAYWDGFLVFDIEDKDQPILEGAIGLVIEEGRTATQGVSVFPL